MEFKPIDSDPAIERVLEMARELAYEENHWREQGRAPGQWHDTLQKKWDAINRLFTKRTGRKLTEADIGGWPESLVSFLEELEAI